MNAVEIIVKKRDGKPLSREEIKFFIDGYTAGKIPDYQASALAMAILCRGMNDRETADLTMAIAKEVKRRRRRAMAQTFLQDLLRDAA